MKLPHELVLEIFSYFSLPGDRRTVIQTSYVCNAWTSISQELLFRNIVLRHEPHDDSGQCAALPRNENPVLACYRLNWALDHSPHLRVYVKEFSADNSGKSWVTEHPAFLSLLCKLSHLERLSLRLVVWSQVENRENFSLPPTLVELELGVIFPNYLEFFRLISGCPSMKTLLIRHTYPFSRGASSAGFPGPAVQQELASKTSITHLDYLELGGHCPELIQFLSAIDQNLVTVNNLSTLISTWSWNHGDVVNFLLPSLERLQHLHLTLRVTSNLSRTFP
jgi:hypothetical protein